MEPLTIAVLALTPSLTVFLVGCGVAAYRMARERGNGQRVGRSPFAADR